VTTLAPVERRDAGEVGHAVGAEGQDRLDVTGGSHADRVASGERGDVGALLVGAVDLGADQLEVGPVDDRPDRFDPLVAGRPLHDPVHHGYPDQPALPPDRGPPGGPPPSGPPPSPAVA
jgi:hypothetical protein